MTASSFSRPRFGITQANAFLYWVSHIIIVGAYLALMMRALGGLNQWLKFAGYVILLFPVYINLLNRVPWLGRMAIATILFAALTVELSFGSGWLILGLTVSCFVIYLLQIVVPLIRSFYWDLGLKRRRLLTFVSLIILLLLLVESFASTPVIHVSLLLFAMWGMLIVLMARLSWLGLRSRWILSIIGGAIVILAPLLTALGFEPSIEPAALMLMLFMLVSYDERLFLSRLAMQVRRFWGSIRHDQIRSVISPTVQPTNLFDRVVGSLSERFRNSGLLSFVTVLFVTSFIIAVLAEYVWLVPLGGEHTVSVVGLLQVGATASLSIVGLYLLWLFIQQRPKNVMLPFETGGGASGEELQPLAQYVTYTMAEEIQRIGQLLRNRQVENVASADSVIPALFVTSGQEAEQIGRLVNLEFPERRLSLANFYWLLVRALARVTVHGLIQRRQDNSLVIQVEITRRRHQTISVDKVIAPSTIGDWAGERFAQKLIHELAAELVYKMGLVTHLSSSFESFQYFIKGLDASRKENWWQAITHYRRAIQIEETERGFFGLGHYHLGAALVSQGELDLGLEQLRIAVRSGPPLPEAHYMLAFTLLYRDADKLSNPDVYAMILAECGSALKLRPFFPEANYLHGLVTYKLAQLRERNSVHDSAQATQTDDREQKPATRPQRRDRSDYVTAAKYLRRAIRQYQRTMRDFGREALSPELAARERARLMRDRMAATHRLADALRALELYSEADTYYEDVLEAFPADLRTLVDRARTYCQAENWQQAVDYIWDHLMPSHMAEWGSAPNFFLGWALSGALLTANAFPFTSWPKRAPVGIEEAKGLFRQAVTYLDYAILSQPRRSSSDPRLDWVPTVVDAAVMLSSKEEFNSYRSERASWQRMSQRARISQATFHYEAQKIEDLVSRSGVTDQGRNGASASALDIDPLRWLAWRMDSYDKCPGELKGLVTRSPSETHEQLKRLRTEAAELLQCLSRENPRQLDRLDYRVAHLNFALKAKKVWEAADKAIPKQGWSDLSTLKTRREVDVYAELSLLTVHMLADARAFLPAIEVASKALKRLGKPASDLGSRQTKVLSPKVLMHQLAALNAWLAYAGWQANGDFPTRALKYLRDKRSKKPTAAVAPEPHIEEAFRINDRQPLALFVKAHILRKQELLGHAIDVFHRLLEVLGTFDPYLYSALYIGDWEALRASDSISGSPSGNTSLGFMGAVTGTDQYATSVNKARVHAALAEALAAQGKPRLSATHMQYAIVWSPYTDLDATNFMQLARRLTESEHLEEALAAIQEVKSRLNRLSPQNRIRLGEARVFESQLLSRLGNPLKAISVAKDEAAWPPSEKALCRAEQLLNFEDSNRPSWLPDNVLKGLKWEDVGKLLGAIDASFFTELSSQEQWLTWACYSRNPEGLSELVVSLKLRQDESSEQHEIVAAQVFHRLTEDALAAVLQAGKALNNIAYAYANLNTNLVTALTHAETSISIIDELKTKMDTSGVPFREYEQSRAYKLDTLGWVHFRRGDNELAVKCLKEASNLVADDADLHYHLARAYTEGLYRTSRGAPTPVDGPDPDQLLRDALRHWHEARRFDTSERIYGKLTRLRDHLALFEQNWEATILDPSLVERGKDKTTKVNLL